MIDRAAGIRASIVRFGRLMEQKLDANEHKPDWKRCDRFWLFEKLCDEVHELSHAIQRSRPMDIAGEAADIANFAMMIVDTLQPDRQEFRGSEIMDAGMAHPADHHLLRQAR